MEKSKNREASDWIKTLELKAHPEGGYYKEVHRSPLTVSANNQTRSSLTSIYFLLTKESSSMFHSIMSDEIWYLHAGNSIHIHTITTEGEYKKQVLDSEQNFQICVNAQDIFAAESVGEEDYSLVSCAVAPGFEFEDFKLYSRVELIERYPERGAVITKFTKG